MLAGKDFWKDLVASGWGMNGSHRNGLDRVPFDGYRAILHRDERVQTAATVRNGDAAALRTNALLGQVLNELRADKTQRGAVGVETIGRLEVVAAKLDASKRVQMRQEARV